MDRLYVRGLGNLNKDTDDRSISSSVSTPQFSQMVDDQVSRLRQTCRVNNLAQTSPTTATELAVLFSRFGSVLQLRQSGGSAVIKMDTPENAATAIAELIGYEFHGQPFTCSCCDIEDDPSAEAASPSGDPSKPPKIPFYTEKDFSASAALAAVRVGSAERQQLKLDEGSTRHDQITLSSTC